MKIIRDLQPALSVLLAAASRNPAAEWERESGTERLHAVVYDDDDVIETQLSRQASKKEEEEEERKWHGERERKSLALCYNKVAQMVILSQYHHWA